MIGIGTPVLGNIETNGDQDWYRVTLTAGTHYFINQLPDRDTGWNFDGAFTVRDASGALLATSLIRAHPHNAFIEFVAPADGEYFIAAAGTRVGGEGGYWLSVDEDIGETIATAADVPLSYEPVTGHIEASSGYDDDLYQVTLANGSASTIRFMSADIAGSLKHAYLQLFNSSGVLLAAGRDEIFYDNFASSLLPSETYYVSIGGLSATDHGDYDIVALGGDVPLPHRSLNDNSYVAPHDEGETAIIDVFLGDGGVLADDGDGSFTSKAWSSAEKTAVRAAFAEFGRVANVRFNLVSSIAEADFAMLKNDNEPGSGMDDDTLGYWWIGGTELDYGAATYDLEGVGVFNSAQVSWNESLEPGGYGYITLVHELGHGLGLKHPFSDGAPGSFLMQGVHDEDDLGDFDLNQGIYTTMSYSDGWVTQPGIGASDNDAYGWQSGLMTLDIAMLQKLYGQVASEAGNTTYTLPSADRTGTSFQAIWDTGGVDTIRYKGSKDAVISLQPATLDYTATGGGVVSYVTGVHGGFTIANGVVIENAKSGSGDDWLQGSLGANRLDGGKGRDTVDYSNRYRPVEVKLAGSAAASVKVDGKAEDIVLNIENVTGGGAGDRLIGDSLGNWLTGNGGADLLRGKGGADRFVFAAKLGAGNADTIADFKHNTDLLALDDKIFKKIGSGLTSSEFYAKAGAHKGHDKDDRLVYDKSAGDLYYDKDGKGGAAAVLFATLKHTPTLDHGDFLIV